MLFRADNGSQLLEGFAPGPAPIVDVTQQEQWEGRLSRSTVRDDNLALVRGTSLCGKRRVRRMVVFCSLSALAAMLLAAAVLALIAYIQPSGKSALSKHEDAVHEAFLLTNEYTKIVETFH